MNLEMTSDKHLQYMERLAKELLEVIRRAKFQDPALIELLQKLEQEAGKTRRERFDESNWEFKGY